jgi:hypothetical protein
MARVNGSVGTSRGFLQAVNKWTKETKERSEEALKIGVLDFAIELNETAPIDTGFLRSSLTAGINGVVPAGPNAEYGSVYNDTRLLGVIDQLKLGDKITLVYQAPYARRLEYGFTGVDSLGRFYNQAGRFWITAAGQKYRSIMRRAATRLRNSTAG